MHWFTEYKFITLLVDIHSGQSKTWQDYGMILIIELGVI